MLIPLRHREPIRFGADLEKCVAIDRQGNPRLALVSDVGEENVLVHDETRDDPSLAFMLSRLASGPDQPTPIGVFRSVDRPEYTAATSQQLAEAVDLKGPGDLKALLHSGATWEVN
jgi:2-oxoglutarate ferredoxin oxidoreductase subunit beta